MPFPLGHNVRVCLSSAPGGSMGNAPASFREETGTPSLSLWRRGDPDRQRPNSSLQKSAPKCSLRSCCPPFRRSGVERLGSRLTNVSLPRPRRSPQLSGLLIPGVSLSAAQGVAKASISTLSSWTRALETQHGREPELQQGRRLKNVRGGQTSH